jgi:acetyl-CoA C-acetyltransferase
VQQRELRLRTDVAPTVTGGMAFAGGPFNNFTYQATAAVVPRLREAPGQFGLVTTVSGLLTKPGLAVWAAEPPAAGALIADFAEEARLATPAREPTAAGSGPATVATYTVTYDGTDPVRAFVVADLEDGRRWIGTCHHPELLARGTTEELIGSTVVVHGAECTPA